MSTKTKPKTAHYSKNGYRRKTPVNKNRKYGGSGKRNTETLLRNAQIEVKKTIEEHFSDNIVFADTVMGAAKKILSRMKRKFELHTLERALRSLIDNGKIIKEKYFLILKT